FEFDKLGTNYRREIIGGLTTFLAMAYILAVNPIMLSLEAVPDLPEAMRMDKGAVFVATALAAAVGSLFMGLIARYPIGLALAMRLKALFPFTVLLIYGIPAQLHLTPDLLSRAISNFLPLCALRELISNVITTLLMYGVGAAIGLFINFHRLQIATILAR